MLFIVAIEFGDRVDSTVTRADVFKHPHLLGLGNGSGRTTDRVMLAMLDPRRVQAMSSVSAYRIMAADRNRDEGFVSSHSGAAP